MAKRGKNDFYEVPHLWGIHRVRHELVWGRPWMIHFLEALDREWTKLMYWQIEKRTGFAKIPLGDISRNGGGPQRAPEGHADHEFKGHVSHRDGVDVDIYYIGADGRPLETRDARIVGYAASGYDQERTKDLGFAILKAGGTHIERIFLAAGDTYLVQEMKKKAHPKIKWHVDSMHNNHFHVRLVPKKPTP